MKLKIVPFKTKYAEDFKQLNIDWLQKYFYVEPRDQEVLGNPENYIIMPAAIFFSLKLMKK